MNTDKRNEGENGKHIFFKKIYNIKRNLVKNKKIHENKI